MNDITKVHPTLQLLAEAVVLESAHQGINIKISECVRTAAEQDAKYAQGRTAPGGTRKGRTTVLEGPPLGEVLFGQINRLKKFHLVLHLLGC
jgi:hypothetical protein